GVELMGELPDGVDVVVSQHPDKDAEAVEFLVPPFLGSALSPEALASLDRLRVIQLLTAGADAWVGRVPEGVILCDGRGIHTTATSEWVLAAILSYVRDFPSFVRAQAREVCALPLTAAPSGTLVVV